MGPAPWDQLEEHQAKASYPASKSTLVPGRGPLGHIQSVGREKGTMCGARLRRLGKKDYLILAYRLPLARIRCGSERTL